MSLDAFKTQFTRRVRDAYTGKVKEVTIDLKYKLVRLHDNVEESDYLLGVTPEDLETIKSKVEAFFDEELSKKIDKTSVRDDLVTDDATMVLSARQGTIIKALIEDLTQILASDDINLDELQEVVTYIKANRETLETLSVNNIAGLPEALDSKVGKVAGKTLTSNDFTNALKQRLEASVDPDTVNRRLSQLESDLPKKAEATTVATLNDQLTQLTETVRLLQEKVGDEHPDPINSQITTTDLSGFE